MAPPTSLSPAGTQDLALALVASSNAPILLLDDALNVIAASKSFCRTFQIEPATAANRPFAALGAGEWNVPQLSSMLRVTASGLAEVQDYEMNLFREGRDVRRLVLSATKLLYDSETGIRLVVAVCDVTDARIAEQLKQDLLEEQKILLKEIHHRVANSLQIIASVLMQSARKVHSEETRSHLFDAHRRVMSVASLQHQLAASRLGDVELRPYLVTLCESISASLIHDHDKLSLEINADESITSADTSVSLGLIITELVINTLKHAFPDNRGGRILVQYRSRGPNWTLSVADNGVGIPAATGAAKVGLGTSIVQALAQQLGATINIADANPGTAISITHTHVPIIVSQTTASGDTALVA